MRTYSLQTGLTLIEILVSAAIVAFGLISVALLETYSIRYNQAAQLRSIAVAQINNMANRIWLNPNAATSGSYNSVSGIPANPNCNNTACTAEQIAQYDVYYWNTLNAAMLPSGQGRITGNGNEFTITIYWDADRTGATGLDCSSNHQIDLSCYALEIFL